VRSAELSLSADHLEAEASTWSLVWFLLGDGATEERDGAAAEVAARHVMAARQRDLGGDPASRFDTGVFNAAPLPAPLSARVRMAARDEDGDPVGRGGANTYDTCIGLGPPATCVNRKSAWDFIANRQKSTEIQPLISRPYTESPDP